jgi:hypothetical protein
VTEFDPIKAAREELVGLSDIAKVIEVQRRDAERRMGEAEVELNGLSKLAGFARQAVADKRAAIDAMLEAQK